MTLAGLIGILPQKSVNGDAGASAVTGVSYDSRTVTPGSVFVCIKGFKLDGHDFVADAVARGAAAVIAERPVDSRGVPVVLVPDSRAALAMVASQFYSHPSKEMRVIGVTGTNGKTTTTHLIRWVLAHSGREAGLVGTVENIVCGKSLPVERTTPEATDLQDLFRRMRSCGSTHAVMEVSSHALELHRVAGTEFDVAVFTNLTQDHLDFHPTMEAYFRAKSILFESLGGAYSGAPKAGRKAAVINTDDPFGRRLCGLVKVQTVTYGLEDGAQFAARDIEMTARGNSFTLVWPGGSARFAMRLAGRFNVYNTLAAVAAAWVEGIDPLDAREALQRHRGVAGRFELVDEGQEFAVAVDYAHTPDGLRNILEAARGVTRGRLICVFGCGGDRDRKKRPIMGEIAARLADFCVITSDNPRSEDPSAVIAEIEPGVRRGGKGAGGYAVEPDRKAAIELAVGMARPGDIVVIAGKGHETYQIFRDRTIYFDDREIAREALRVRTLGGPGAR
ncbi:MAG: UDP-N-acetylmuramoyl-L-alanyl-D-glutamate--2,6-diaminopimelate ligase [Firmicutes bacterium]|nr:UDP-N-acetylmuramoyl-L-alanyl-D-glutamate--2,6-diaminopimelate ligase [Bacillota bacterium]